MRARNGRVWIIVATLAVLTLGVLAYRFRGHLSSGFGLLAEATGGKTLAALSLAFALLLLVCIFFWMTFPILVYFGLRDLRRHTARLDQTAQLCVQQLAELKAQQVSKADGVSEQKQSGPVPR